MSKKISELPDLPVSPPTDGSEVIPVNKGGVTYKGPLSQILAWLKPMTTLGDMIVGGAAGLASRLGIGTNGQILTVVSGQPQWAAAPTSGFANPMTTAGDLIRGGTSGAATRLAIGTNGQVLQVSGGAVAWGASPSVFSAAAYTTPQTVAFSATPTFNAALSNVFYLGALTANVTSVTISNPSDGQAINIRVAQNATGGFTFTLPAGVKADGGINTGANRVSWLNLIYVASASQWEGSWSQVPA